MLQPTVQVSDAAIKAAVEAALKSGGVIADQGVLGACLILSLLGNVALVWLLMRVQNLRVQDLNGVHKVAQEMVATFSKVDGALEEQNEAGKTQHLAIQGVTTTLNTLMLALVSRGTVFHQSPVPNPPHNTPGSTGGTT